MKMLQRSSSGSRAAERYASAVARELRGIAREKRRALVDGLREHLREYPEREDFAARLGSPAEYAAELRRSAGLPAARPRGWIRRLPLWLRIALPVLVVLAVAAVVIVTSADVQSPLHYAGGSWVPGTTAPPEFGDKTAVALHYQHGQEYQFAFQMENDGHFPVTVDRVDFARLLFSPLQVEEVRLGPRGEQGMSDGVEQFHAFHLDPGEFRNVFFYGVFAFCEHAERGGSTEIEGPVVHFHVLGLGETQEVPMIQPISIPNPGPNTPQCPVPRAVSSGSSSGSIDSLSAGLIVAGIGYEMTVVPDVAPPAGGARPEVVPQCDGAAPAGTRVEPLYLNVSGEDAYDTGDQPIDLRLTLRSNGRPLMLQTGSGNHCRPATQFHVVAGGRGNPTVLRGVAYVDAQPCPVQEIHVEARNADGTWVDGGNLRLYVPCG